MDSNPFITHLLTLAQGKSLQSQAWEGNKQEKFWK